MKVNFTTLDRLLMFHRAYNEIRAKVAEHPAAADDRIREIKKSLNNRLDDEGKSEFKELFSLLYCAYEDKCFDADNELVNLSIQLGMKIQQSLDSHEANDED